MVNAAQGKYCWFLSGFSKFSENTRGAGLNLQAKMITKIMIPARINNAPNKLFVVVSEFDDEYAAM